MRLHDLIIKVQNYSGFSNAESKDALEHLVECLAVHLPEAERKNFANQLPDLLHDIALSVLATEENSKKDILQQFMENQHVGKKRARRQMLASWGALKEAISEKQITYIRHHLPRRTIKLLH